MRTRWGSCNIEARLIWLNLELAKKPPQYLEYILVHEMVHLLERHHNGRFRRLMDRFLPNWRLLREELNRLPLAHEDWKYRGQARDEPVSFSSWHVGVAAEACAAGQFARCGLDVSVQYGANQPAYDRSLPPASGF